MLGVIGCVLCIGTRAEIGDFFMNCPCFWYRRLFIAKSAQQPRGRKKFTERFYRPATLNNFILDLIFGGLEV